MGTYYRRRASSQPRRTHGWSRPHQLGADRGIEDEAPFDLSATRVDERANCSLAARDESAELRLRQAAARRLEPHDEFTAIAPALASPPARARDQIAALATRAREWGLWLLRLRCCRIALGLRGLRLRRTGDLRRR